MTPLQRRVDACVEQLTLAISGLLLGSLDLLLEDLGEVVDELVVIAERRLERRQQRLLLLLQTLDVLALRGETILYLDDLRAQQQRRRYVMTRNIISCDC